jgi:hypothetical protein
MHPVTSTNAAIHRTMIGLHRPEKSFEFAVVDFAAGDNEDGK